MNESAAASGRETTDHDCAPYSRLVHSVEYMGADLGRRGRWVYACSICDTVRTSLLERVADLPTSHDIISEANEILASHVARDAHPAGSDLPDRGIPRLEYRPVRADSDVRVVVATTRVESRRRVAWRQARSLIGTAWRAWRVIRSRDEREAGAREISRSGVRGVAGRLR